MTFNPSKLFGSVSFYFIVFCALVTCEAFQVSFNEHANGAGEEATIEANDGICYNFNPAWNDRASRLTTPYFACLDIYENASCSGRVQHYPAGYAMYVELGETLFNDFITIENVKNLNCEVQVIDPLHNDEIK